MNISEQIIIENKSFSITLPQNANWQRHFIASYNSITKNGYSIVGIIDNGSDYVDNGTFVWDYNRSYGLYVSVYWTYSQTNLTVRCSIIYKKD